MKIGVPKETYPDERRVALIPNLVPLLTKKGLEIYIESNAGLSAGFSDQSYQEKLASICQSRQELFQKCDVILQVRGFGANSEHGQNDLDHYKRDQIFIAFQDPLSEPQAMQKLAQKNVTVFSMELIPRITRAQSMDALSSMATIAGYKAVLIAADKLPKMFPMMMTAAGTITPAKVFVIGAGVAGLQAIASAKRLGAVVSAYDLRPAVREQVESLGCKFIEIALEAQDSETKGRYAKEMGEEFYQKQREMMTKVVGESDVVITTAAIPGKKAPLLITSNMVDGMGAGSVIVDLAAERGGNCQDTKPGETVLKNGVTIFGPMNLPSSLPYHASQMYAKNVCNFLSHLIKDGELKVNQEDEITRETMVTYGGNVVHPRIKELLN